MSVQSNQYLMYGVELDYVKNYKELEDDEQFKILNNFCDSAYKTNDIDRPIMAIIDGMSGKYMRVGKVILKSENYKPLNGCIDINNIELPKRSKLKKLIKENFGVDVKKSDFKLMLFQHLR